MDRTDRSAPGAAQAREVPAQRDPTAPGASRKTPAGRAGPRRIRICLAASGGGHIRQLLDIEPVWRAEDHFFVADDTPLARSISAEHRVHLVAHWALGQARLGAPFKMIAASIRNLVQSARVILRERPSLVISTGAGTVFFSVLFGRLIGAKVIVIESFARFDRPSLFARLAGPLAHHKIIQSAALHSFWPDAALFNPLRMLTVPRPIKEPLLFATVGATLKFDRLIDMVADVHAQGGIPERVVLQTGIGGRRVEGLECFETLPFGQMQQLLRRADLVICHGGTGSLITALREGCRTIAVPRLRRMGEVYDDHQAEITEAFAARRLIEVANDAEELAAAIQRARSREPVMATSDASELIAYLQDLIGPPAPQDRLE